MDELYFITPEYLNPYLGYIKENKRLFKTAMKNVETLRLNETYNRMFEHVFEPILERFQVSAQDRQYMMMFYVCGLIAVFTHGSNTGHRVNVGGEFGHETVSRVVKVGRNVTDFAVGERVYPYPLYAKDDTNRAGTIGGIAFLLTFVNLWLSCPSRRAYRSYKVLTPSGKT